MVETDHRLKCEYYCEKAGYIVLDTQHVSSEAANTEQLFTLQLSLGFGGNKLLSLFVQQDMMELC